MATIRIRGIEYSNSAYRVLITLVETQDIEGQPQEVPLGETVVKFPSDTEMADVKSRIIKAAEAIWKSHQNAQDKRHDIEELDFPPIP